MHETRTGLDRWLIEGPECAGLTPDTRIGLVVHAASVDRRAHHAIERLGAPGGNSRLVRLFAPEHGIFGHEQDMESVGAQVEPHTGLPVVSLYGNDFESLRPPPGSLDEIDAVVFDLQDIGARYYTYIYTLSFIMEAARDAGLPVVVLDRPNPIGGRLVEGPILHPGFESFVGRFPIPVRHGMTVGELAGLFNDAFGIGCDLRVVTLDGWRREMSFEQTGLPWIPPSPNMPSLATARVYPGGCLVEGTNLSEGRGTTVPFEVVGAPWIDAVRFAETLRDQRLPGVLFRAASFRPETRKHAGSACGGVQVIVHDAESFRPFATFLVVLREARRLAPDAFEWRTEVYEFESSRLAIDLLLGRKELKPMIESGASLAEFEAIWRDDAERFAALRRDHLLYD